MKEQTQPATQPELPTRTYVFSSRELARLAVYRAATIAGFYNEHGTQASFPIRQTLRTWERRNSDSSN
jgi:hypothetical protein